MIYYNKLFSNISCIRRIYFNSSGQRSIQYDFQSLMYSSYSSCTAKLTLFGSKDATITWPKKIISTRPSPTEIILNNDDRHSTFSKHFSMRSRISGSGGIFLGSAFKDRRNCHNNSPHCVKIRRFFFLKHFHRQPLRHTHRHTFRPQRHFSQKTVFYSLYNDSMSAINFSYSLILDFNGLQTVCSP